MERENQRVAITKRLLKESMLRLLADKDIDKISITELCRDAGINRATFYRHYEIPRDVLIEIEKDLYYDLKRCVMLPTEPGEIKASIEQLCSYLEQNIDLLRMIIRCNSDTDFAFFINEIYMESFAELSRTNALKRFSPEDMKLMTLYCAGGSYFVLRHWLMGNVRKPAADVAAYVYELMNRMDWVTISRQYGFFQKNDDPPYR